MSGFQISNGRQLHRTQVELHGKSSKSGLSRNSVVVVARAPVAAGKTQVSTNNAKGGTAYKTVQSKPQTKTVRTPKPSEKKGGRFYFNVTGFPFPIGPFFERNTVRYEVEKNQIWIFEQTQALELFNVFTPVRMTVIKLKSGGLWVHAPVAPTDECIRLLKELNAPVEYIVLPTFAYEHKVFVGPFSRRFPKAKVFVTPYQWSFPLNLPPQFFGIFPEGELTTGDPDVPWADEIEQKLFLPPSIGVGNYVRFSEVAFFHKRTRTLLVTDAVVYVSDKVPEVIPRDAVLESAQDNWLAKFIAGGMSRREVEAVARKGRVEDTEENRRIGWQRMALLVLYFGPSNLLQPQESFRAISNKLFVGPVVETLVYSKVPAAVRQWVDEICADWSFRQIIPCHFAAPIKAGPAEFKRAFAFAYQQTQSQASQQDERPDTIDVTSTSTPIPSLSSSSSSSSPSPSTPWWSQILGKLPLGGALTGGEDPKALVRPVVFPEADMKILNGLNNALLRSGAVKANADVM